MLPIPAGGSLYHLFMHNYTHMHGGDAIHLSDHAPSVDKL